MADNGRLNVKDAVRVAVAYVKDLLAPEQLSDVRLEEVELSDDGEYWFVTVGFSLPELQKQTEAVPTSSIVSLLRPKPLGREYKVVKIHARSGDAQSMKIRQP